MRCGTNECKDTCEYRTQDMRMRYRLSRSVNEETLPPEAFLLELVDFFAFAELRVVQFLSEEYDE